MKIAALATLAVTAQAATFCDKDNVVYTNNNQTANEPIVCGSTTNTNCNSYAEDSFCSLGSATDFATFPRGVGVCCKSNDEPAHEIFEKNTCKKCLEDNTASSTPNTWDGVTCFNADGAVFFPNSDSSSLSYLYTMVTDVDKCGTDCQKLNFYGTCWRRCGSRGWGVDPNVAYYGATGSYYGGGGMYGMYQGGMYNQGVGGFSGAYGGYSGYSYGTVPSAFGAPCPDPAQISMFPDAPAVPPIWGGFAQNGMYGMYGMYNSGMYGQSMGMYGGGMYGQSMGMYGQSMGMYGQSMGMYNGMYGQSMGMYGQSMGMYGRQWNMQGSQSQYVGSVYGGQGMGAVVTRPTTSVYGTTSPAYVGSVYGGPSVYGGSSVYGGVAQQATIQARCEPISQCSCDTGCCKRGDCCHDVSSAGCSTSD